AVNTESMANSCATLMPALSSKRGVSTNAAFSPSPQLAPVEANVKFSSARTGRDMPNSASASAAAPQPSAALNWRLSIPLLIRSLPLAAAFRRKFHADARALPIVAQTGVAFQYALQDVRRAPGPDRDS